MKLLLIPVLVLVVVGGCWADSTTEVPPSSPVAGSDSPSSSKAPDGSSPAPGASTSQNPSDASSPGTPGSTNAPESTTTVVQTTTPLVLTTFKISNDLTPQDAKLILQQALQLDKQINDLNTYLINAKQDTDVNNSPLFAQLNAASANITAQNATLQGYISQLQALQTTQASIDQQVNSASDTFVCFANSGCVTAPPTTPAPTSPGPTPSVTPCTSPSPLKATSVSATYNQDPLQNSAQCSVSVQATTTTNNVSIAIDIVISGNNASVTLVETRTKRSVTFNSTTTGYNFTGFQQVDVQYFSDPRSTVQFNFTYVEVNNCLLDCHSPNGTCRVSQSGVQYCECRKCQFTGDDCETPLDTPCQGKQRRVCGENQKNSAGEIQPYGKCYLDICADQCYACECSKGLEDPDNAQTCKKPTDDTYPLPDPAPTGPTVCPTTPAPTTTVAILTSTIAASTPSGGATTASSASTTAAGSPGTAQTDSGSTTVAGSDTSTTVPAGSSTSNVQTTISTGPASGEVF